MRLQPDPKLHSCAHVLADDLSKMFEEPKRFAAYLGIAQRYAERDLRGLARVVKQRQNLPAGDMGRYFFASVRNLRTK